MELNLDLGRGEEKYEAFDSLKAQTSLRMTYEAQAKVLERQLGGLEGVRSSLGLSQRKMAQLLMVDPSAWTRWMKTGKIPPHIWRALQWYLALNEKIPGLTPQYFLSEDGKRLGQQALDEIKAVKQAHQAQERRFVGEFSLLKKQLFWQRWMTALFALTSLILAATNLWQLLG